MGDREEGNGGDGGEENKRVEIDVLSQTQTANRIVDFLLHATVL